MHYSHVQVSVGPDAIGWRGLPSDPSIGCITPPPFGQQCTLPRSLALVACVNMPGCVAIVCPSQEPYRPGGGGKVKEPICQLRGHTLTNEKGHGMCRPSGCVTAVFTRESISSQHTWAAFRPPRTRLIQLESSSDSLLSPLLEPSPAWPNAYRRLTPVGIDPTLRLYAVAVRSMSPGRRLRGEDGDFVLAPWNASLDTWARAPVNAWSSLTR